MESFTSEISDNNAPLIVSIVGSTVPDFTEIVNKLKKPEYFGVWVKLVCPHVDKMGMEIGDDPKAVYDIVKNIKNNSSKPIIRKGGNRKFQYH